MSFWERFTGKVVDAAALGQKKRAVATGITAFDDPLRDLRLGIEINSHPWLQNSAVISLLLSTWAAQALQDMAAVLETTAHKQVGEPGMLPEATFALADGLYSAALAWIEQAQTALLAVDTDPGFELPVGLPAKAPRLDYLPDAPPAHFVAVIQAAGQLGIAVENALNNAQNDRSRLPRKYDGAFEVITRAIQVARAKLDQVEAAESDRQAVRLGQDIWAMLQEVVSLYFRAGQQVAKPALIDPKYDAYGQAFARAPRLPPPPATPPPPPPAGARPGPWTNPPGAYAPGAPVQSAGIPGAPAPWPPPAAPGTQPAPFQPPVRQPSGPARPPVQVGGGYAPRTMPAPAAPVLPPAPPPAQPTLGERLGLSFDAWDLTDQGAKATYRNDPTRIAELEAFWRADTNPDETRRLFGLIHEAVQSGQVAARPGEFSRACPWISTFVALTDVRIGSDRFRAGQMFSLKAGLQGDYFGREFERLGFIPGAQQPKPIRASAPAPEPGQAAGAPPIDARRTGDRKPPLRRSARGSGSQPAGPVLPSDADMWRLTAAFQRAQRRANSADAEQLRQLWRADPDPAHTLSFHDELMAAVSAGNVRQHGDEGLRDCPWSQVYVAVRPVTIGGVELRQNEKFALQVGVTEGRFRRTILRLGLIRASA